MSQAGLSTSAHKLNPPVFYGSSAFILLLVGFTVLFPERAAQWFTAAQRGIIGNASWFYVTAVALILICVAYLGPVSFWRHQTGA